ncbi:MAG: glutaredoxin family protein [Acidobacteriota bacterium]
MTRAAAVLYSRPSCPLCFAMRRAAERASRRHGIALQVVDISGDPGLMARYGQEIPVLILPDGRTLRGRAEGRDVEAAFRDLGRETARCRARGGFRALLQLFRGRGVEGRWRGSR